MNYLLMLFISFCILVLNVFLMFRPLSVYTLIDKIFPVLLGFLAFLSIGKIENFDFSLSPVSFGDAKNGALSIPIFLSLFWQLWRWSKRREGIFMLWNFFPFFVVWLSFLGIFFPPAVFCLFVIFATLAFLRHRSNFWLMIYFVSGIFLASLFFNYSFFVAVLYFPYGICFSGLILSFVILKMR